MRGRETGARLAQVLGALGLKQVALAREMGCRADTLSKKKRGLLPITGDDVLFFQRAYGVNPEFWERGEAVLMFQASPREVRLQRAAAAAQKETGGNVPIVRYFCSRCRQEVGPGAPACHTCGGELTWDMIETEGVQS